MHLRRVYSDESGATHFGGIVVDFPATAFVPGRPAIGLSTPYRASAVAFARVSSAWDGAWHPAPRRQFGIVLSGGLDIETSDGQVERFVTGSVFLLEDTTGAGHRTVVLAGTDLELLFVWLDPES